jgi:hypothetical protein
LSRSDAASSSVSDGREKRATQGSACHGKSSRHGGRHHGGNRSSGCRHSWDRSLSLTSRRSRERSLIVCLIGSRAGSRSRKTPPPPGTPRHQASSRRLYLAIWVVFNGPVQSTMFLARHEHDLTRNFMGQTGTKPAGSSMARPDSDDPMRPVSRHNRPAVYDPARHDPCGPIGGTTLARPPRHHPQPYSLAPYKRNHAPQPQRRTPIPLLPIPQP